MNRNLDGVYFRVERDGKWHSICFSDLTESEMDKVMSGRSELWSRELAKQIAFALKNLGNELDVICE